MRGLLALLVIAGCSATNGATDPPSPAEPDASADDPVDDAGQDRAGAGRDGADRPPAPVDGNRPESPPSTSTTQFQSIGLGPFAVCVADTASLVTCFGRVAGVANGGARHQAPANLNAVALTGHHTGACSILKEPPAADQAIRCWGAFMGTIRPPRVVDPVALTSGNVHACALGRAGSVTCWGEAGHTPPAGLQAKRIASLVFDCAIASDDRVVCWGPGAPAPPADLKAKRIAVGGLYDGTNSHACAITLDDSVVCWGAASSAINVPAGLKGREIATGNTATCAVRMDDGITCWGAGGSARPPAGLRARFVLMNYMSAVAVTMDGRMVFWGDLRDGKDMPPDLRVLLPPP